MLASLPQDHTAHLWGQAWTPSFYQDWAPPQGVTSEKGRRPRTSLQDFTSKIKELSEQEKLICPDSVPLHTLGGPEFFFFFFGLALPTHQALAKGDSWEMTLPQKSWVWASTSSATKKRQPIRWPESGL